MGLRLDSNEEAGRERERAGIINNLLINMIFAIYHRPARKIGIINKCLEIFRDFNQTLNHTDA